MVDNVDPVATCVAPFTVELDASGDAVITADSVDLDSEDECGIEEYSLDQSSFTCADVDTAVTVTLTVLDPSENSGVSYIMLQPISSHICIVSDLYHDGYSGGQFATDHYFLSLDIVPAPWRRRHR